MKTVPMVILTLTLLISACVPVSLAASPDRAASDDSVVQAEQESEKIPDPQTPFTAETCPVTLPSEKLFSPPAPYPATAPYENEYWYGTEALWTMLPADGQWGQLARGEKMFWWRDGFDGSQENNPRLTVSARLLDAQTSPVAFGPPATNAYHADFHWAMLIGVTLPSTGCWEITGHYDKHDLSFVVWVGE